MSTLTQETIDAFRALERGFMTPSIFCGPVTIDCEDGAMPSEDWLTVHCPVEEASRIEEEREGWLIRLSANGYLDCTDWMGPFDSEEEAIEALVDTYGDF